MKSASIQSGQAGSQHGATIAGSINLEREHSSFDQQGFSGTLFSGLETNNLQKYWVERLGILENASLQMLITRFEKLKITKLETLRNLVFSISKSKHVSKP